MLVKDIFQQMGLNYTCTYTLPVNVRIFFFMMKEYASANVCEMMWVMPRGGGVLFKD